VFGALLYGVVASTEGIPGLDIVDASRGLQDNRGVPLGKRRPVGAAIGRVGGAPAPGADRLFTRLAIDLAAQRPGRTLMVLQAGCTTAGQELDLPALRAAGHDLEVCLVDDEIPATRAAVAARPELAAVTLGELRTVPLKPRSFDIVQCSLLLHRISNAELVLGRLAASLRPGGLLLLRLADGDSAAGFLDRRMPEILRTLAWRRTRPGQPGPFPAVYEPVASARGIETFATRHGLAIAHRSLGVSADRASRHRPSGHRASGASAAGRLVAWVSAGRFSCKHDELIYVIRRPEDSFARVLQ
jgi:SAM-dependent methyltransferase